MVLQRTSCQAGVRSQKLTKVISVLLVKLEEFCLSFSFRLCRKVLSFAVFEGFLVSADFVSSLMEKLLEFQFFYLEFWNRQRIKKP